MPYLNKKNIEDIYPLSPMQQGMLFHTLYDAGSSAYSEQFSCIIEGGLDLESFERAWNHLIDAHPVFRTVFNWKDTPQPLQIVLKKRPVRLQIHDLSHLRDTAEKEAIEAFLKTDKQTPYDLSRGPLIRLHMLNLSGRRFLFLWSYHHIILDGWCLSLILTDFFATYTALSTEGPLPVIRRPLYKQYIAWLKQQDHNEPREFWTPYLRGFSAPTPLPWDRPRADGLDIGECLMRLDGLTTQRLEDFARQQRTTLSTVVQALWALLLGRYSQNTDVVFGLTVSGRPAGLRGAGDMVGLFINTLPVRAKIDEQRTFTEFLAQFAQGVLGVMDYEHVFLPEIKAWSDIEGGESLFDSILVFENYPLDPAGFSVGSDMSFSHFSQREITNFDLTLVALPGDELSFRLSYNACKFDERTAERILGHIRTLVGEILDRSQAPVGDLEILGEAEKTLLLTTFNATGRDYPQEACLQDFIEAAVDRYPQHTALVSGGTQLSYAELEARANRLAHYLRAQGIGPGATVGIFMERSIEMVVGVLGVIKAGGTYVPLDCEYPRPRIEYLVQDCGAGMILAQEGVLDRLPAGTGVVICLDRDWGEIAGFPESRPERVTHAGDLVYIIYTSGSTGNPKGIEIEHRGLVNYLSWAVEAYGIRDGCTFPLYTSMTFDLTVTSLFCPLIAGQSILILPSGLDPTALVQQVLESDCDIAKLTPAHLEIADSLAASGLRKGERLNRLILGGEALSAAVSRSMLARYPGLTIYNEYGPAETVVGCSVHAFSELPQDCTQVSIGRPIANTRIRILDRHMRLVPIGVPGEICISSPGVARGYLNKPEATARVFGVDPFLKDARIYRSGDIGRWLADGTLEYLGRSDHQIKIRGFRIELGEIEAVLASHIQVHDCVVMDREDAAGRKFLVGYYVADSELPLDTLRAHLRETLPDYMVPSRFMYLDGLPLTPNGKVDRGALPQVEGTRSEAEREYVPPRNVLEAALAEVWQEVLGLDRVGINDNFFDLGGDSIMSLQVVSRMKARGYDVRPRDIFEHDSLASLSLMVNECASVRIDQSPVSGSAPLTPIQRWFFDLGLKNVHHFNQALMFETAIPLEADGLRQSLQALINHHDALRLRIREGAQEFSPPGVEFPFDQGEVRDATELGERIQSLQASFNITEGPVFGAGLFRLGSRDFLVLSAHHLVVDGMSWRILLEDLFGGYAACLSGSEIRLPAKTTSYKEWAQRLKDYAENDKVAREAAYWEAELAEGLAALETDQDSGPNDVASSDMITLNLDENKTAQLLRDAHRAYNTEVSDLLVAALMRAVNRWRGVEVLAIEMEGHGREDLIPDLDLSRTVGWFTTIFPVVLDATRLAELSGQVKYVKEKLHGLPAKGFHYGILKYLNGHYNLPINIGIGFNYMGQIARMDAHGLIASMEANVPGLIDARNLRAHLIDVLSAVVDGRFRISFVYSRNHFRREGLQALVDMFQEDLDQVIRHCLDPASFDITPSDFDLIEMTQEELEDLYDE